MQSACPLRAMGFNKLNITPLAGDNLKILSYFLRKVQKSSSFHYIIFFLNLESDLAFSKQITQKFLYFILELIGSRPRKILKPDAVPTITKVPRKYTNKKPIVQPHGLGFVSHQIHQDDFVDSNPSDIMYDSVSHFNFIM